jgi:hypothetical protein
VDATIGYDLMGRVTSKGATAFAATSTLVYNAKGQLSTETSTKTVISGGNTTVTTNVATYTYGTGSAYALGSALTIRTTSTSVLNGGSPTNNPTTLMTNTYVWWDGAVQDHQAYKPNESSGPTHDSQYTYAQVGGAAQLTTVTTDDGRPRTVTFRNDMNGQAIRRDEADNNASYGDPHEVWYRFAGKQIGFTGNNGAPDAEIANSSSGAFAGGSTSPTYYTDFDLSLTSYAFGSSRSIASTYAVEQGDTLESIAAMLWGDASLWYKIAEANGLQGGATLTAGQTLIIPAGIVRSSHNASTFAPYDPGEVINPITLTAPKPPKQGKGCGALGQILLVVIAVAVTIWTAGALSQVSGGILGAIGSSGVATGAVAGAAGSIASQAIGVATGIQDKFSWNAVALAAVGGAIGGSGIGDKFSKMVGVVGGSGQAAVAGAFNNALTQGIGVAAGLQKDFSWAGVAAAGVGAAAFQAASTRLPGAAHVANGAKVGATAGNRMGASMASAIADAGARTLIEGSDFGDNLMAALPNVIGQTVGEAIAGQISRSSAISRYQREAGIRGSRANTQVSRETIGNWMDMGWSDADIRDALSIHGIRDGLITANLTRADGISELEATSRVDSVLSEPIDLGEAEAIVVIAERRAGDGPSGGSIIRNTVVGSAQFLDGVSELEESHPWLVNGALTGATFLAGGPIKSIVRRATGAVGDEFVSLGANFVGNKVGQFVTAFAQRRGWVIGMSLAGMTGEADASVIGGAANVVSATTMQLIAGGIGGDAAETVLQRYRAFSQTWRTGRAAYKQLRSGVEQARRGVTTGDWQAHHLVPLNWKSDAADAARIRLGHFQIDINDVSNGVGLPASVHRNLDNDVWSEHVERSLAQAQSRPQAIAILDGLVDQLVNDPTPFLRRR